MSGTEAASGTPSRKRSRNALRFKHGTRRPPSRTSRSPQRVLPYDRSRSERQKRHQQHHIDDTIGESLDPDDEAFYGTGAGEYVEPSLASSYAADDFTERLFDALADDEGRDHWQNLYGQSLDDFVHPDAKDAKGLNQQDMNDDEYAAFVRRGMWERKHGERLRSTNYPGRGDDKQDEYTQQDFSSSRTDTRSSSGLGRNFELEQRWKKYLQSWEHLGTAQWTMTSVPWPNVSARVSDISKQSVSEFLSHAGNLKALAKEELRRRWHPDRFQQKTKKHIAEAEWTSIFTIVTSIAQILNQIIND